MAMDGACKDNSASLRIFDTRRYIPRRRVIRHTWIQPRIGHPSGDCTDINKNPTSRLWGRISSFLDYRQPTGLHQQSLHLRYVPCHLGLMKCRVLSGSTQARLAWPNSDKVKFKARVDLPTSICYVMESLIRKTVLLWQFPSKLSTSRLPRCQVNEQNKPNSIWETVGERSGVCPFDPFPQRVITRQTRHRCPQVSQVVRTRTQLDLRCCHQIVVPYASLYSFGFFFIDRQQRPSLLSTLSSNIV